MKLLWKYSKIATNLRNKVEHMDIDSDVNQVLLVFLSQNLTLESINLESKVVRTIFNS